MIPAWHSTLVKWLVKSPKPLFADAGLEAYLAGVDSERLERETALWGALVESLVAGELVKQLGWSEHALSLYGGPQLVPKVVGR